MKLTYLIITIFIFLIPLKTFSQHNTTEITYVNKKSFKTIQKKYPQIDSLGFKVENSDTLIKVNPELISKMYNNMVKVPYEYKDSTFLDIYKNVVYRTHLVPKENNKWKMKLWKDTLKVYFNKAVPKSHKKSLMKLASKVSRKVDSLNIIQVNNLKDSNYIIYYINKEEPFDYELAIKTKNLDIT